MRTLWLLLCLSALALPSGAASWSVLAEGDPSAGEARVSCTEEGGKPWCKSEAVLPASPDAVEAVLTDFSRYTEVFLRVTSCRVLEPQVVHVTLDMPAPLSDRDYIARFERSVDGADRVFRWKAVEHPLAPPGEAVRLVRSAGEWRLSPAAGGKTRLTYTWEAELGGDIPEWALPRAWTVQGTEVVEWLIAALS